MNSPPQTNKVRISFTHSKQHHRVQQPARKSKENICVYLTLEELAARAHWMDELYRISVIRHERHSLNVAFSVGNRSHSVLKSVPPCFHFPKPVVLDRLYDPNRRRYLGAAAMTLAAAPFGAFGSQVRLPIEGELPALHGATA